MTEEIQQIHEAVKELRETVSSKFAETGDSREKIAKINEALDKYEDQNQQITQDLLAAKKREDELSEKLIEMEKTLTRLPRATSKEEVSMQRKAFDAYLKLEKDGVIDPELRKFLRTDSASHGGVLVDPDYIREIDKKITEISPVRQVAKVRQTSSKSIEVPLRNTLVNAYWTGEAASTTASNSTYQMNEIVVNKVTVESAATREMLNDAAFNIGQEITSDAIERFAQIEGAAFVNGDGNNKPFGLLTNTDVAVLPGVGAPGALSGDDLNNLTGALKTGYNGVYMMNRRTIAEIRNLKGTNGQYLWIPSLSAGDPATIAGEPYVSAIDMPDVAPNSTPIIYGDYFRAYTIVDSVNMEVLRNDYIASNNGIVVFYFYKYTGGQVVLADALVKLQIPA